MVKPSTFSACLAGAVQKGCRVLVLMPDHRVPVLMLDHRVPVLMPDV